MSFDWLYLACHIADCVCVCVEVGVGAVGCCWGCKQVLTGCLSDGCFFSPSLK